MPPTCPDGFDRHIWEKIAKRPLSDTFLVELAAELKKKRFCIDAICDCLSLNKPDSKAVKGQPNVAADRYDQYHVGQSDFVRFGKQSMIS